MIDTRDFGTKMQKLGFSFYTGVPCSFLKHLINFAINECDYVGAANEGDAVAIAAGAFTAGKKPVVLMQNSGLSNAVSPMVSLNYIFRIPVLGFVSLRGEPGKLDEPQHELMGRITIPLLELLQVKWMILSMNMEEAENQLMQAAQWIKSNRSFFFIVRKGTFANEPLQKQQLTSHKNEETFEQHGPDQLPSRREALTIINAMKDDHTVQLATTGKTGRELYEIEDSPQNLYMVGSMGCISSFGLGLALNHKNIDTVVIDGDASLLLRMGSLAINGYCRPPNLLHIVLDNNAHDSTGGQSTVSHNVNFVQIAASCGYQRSVYIHNLSELESRILEWKQKKALTFLCMKIAKGSNRQLGRPRIKPYQVKERLMKFLLATPPS